MRRITSHPIIDTKPPDGRKVQFSFEGKTLKGVDGEPIAAALTAYGIFDLHYTHQKKEARGIFCGIGQCQECVMVVDGIPNVRTCVTPLREGMAVERQHGRGVVPSDHGSFE